MKEMVKIRGIDNIQIASDSHGRYILPTKVSMLYGTPTKRQNDLGFMTNKACALPKKANAEKRDA